MKKAKGKPLRMMHFLKIVAALVQQPLPLITSPVIRRMPEHLNQFRYGMTNLRPNSSMVSHQRSVVSTGNAIYVADELVWTCKYCTHV